MKNSTDLKWRTTAVLVALFFVFFVGMESLALARIGGGRSFGSRGFSSGSSSRTYQRSTPTRPTQPAQPTQPTQQPATPGMGRSFLSGLGGGLLGGMIGSMLFGGHAGAGGWGSGAGFGFGDFILILIILTIVYFVIKHFRARRTLGIGNTGMTYGSSPYREVEVYPSSPTTSSRGDIIVEGLRHIGEMDPGFSETVFKELAEDDFFKIQGAWTRRDLSPIKHLLTPQALNTFQEDASKLIADKQFNRLENIAVRQVEIVDAVQDQGEEYITVKFLASLLDYTVDEVTGKTVSGSSSDPVKFLEYWTFTRKVGEKDWRLAGITQEGDY
ncbi:MAG: Tim44 domain-containing protein [Syntrophorhabdus aromaticivorans]|uniref:Tim44 domain-containing protein n=1 Tax=Syntrophorhabdus aromaticivorans TaxID=328301 RepID=A0A351TYW5_9BACT|nr:Tim44 domain-containing protein [Syntrophorhabdus aromaticivorans]HBA52896.1 Tim44 domain-containing protein [Syntrophorhabdus aromaticivorans]